MDPGAPPMGFGSKHGHWDGIHINHDASPDLICDITNGKGCVKMATISCYNLINRCCRFVRIVCIIIVLSLNTMPRTKTAVR